MLKNKFLIGIFLLGFLLRFIGLGSFPSGFDADEAAFGYNTYSIIKTGADEYGKLFPLSLKSFGEYKPALYSYLSIPSVLALDISPFSVRFVSALFGSLTILLLYFLVNKVSKNYKLAFVSAFLLAISPWHINLSRTVSEVTLSIFFNLTMFYSLFAFKESNNKRWLMLATAAAVLSIFSYTASRFFVPILASLFIFLYRGKDLISSLRSYKIFIVFILAVVIFYTFLDSANRVKQISIFETPQTKLVLEEQIRESQGKPVFLTRAFHNKVVNYSRTIIENYASYFTLDYLFLKGGHPQRMRVPDAGLFYFWQLPFILVGLYLAFKNKDRIASLMMLWWFITLAPVALTFDEIPNVYRSAIILPPVIYICSLGITSVFNKKFKFKRAIITGLVVIAIWEFFYYGMQYIRQDMHRPWYRGYAYKELVSDIQKDYEKYDKFIVTKANSSPYIYILFYSKFDPKKYQSLGSPRDLVANGGFDKYLFSEHDCPSYSFSRKELGDGTFLFIDAGSCKELEDAVYQKTTKLIKTIYWKDSTKAFKLLEYKPL